MLYTLPDGRIVDLTCVSEVSTIRDLGVDPNTIYRRRIGFSISLKKREILDVVGYYHYNDWVPVRNGLNKIREDLLCKLELVGSAS